MGVVVAATHLQLHQKVALKFMLGKCVGQASMIERFVREARAAARLRSDHVARVIDVGTLETGSPYIVMEYLEGTDLGSLIETRGRLGIELSVDCLLQACDAVAEAHAIGIVHRDLKPRNLFLTTRNDGSALVKVLDFGISKHTTGVDHSLTSTSEVIGSPSYMSPEQFRSAKSVDQRSDIWALGTILYELLTGQLPFVAETITALAAMVLIEEPRPLLSFRDDIPLPLARTIERCIKKDPASRFQSVAELALALQPFASPATRELATRIARIGASASEAVAGASVEAKPARSATTVNWVRRLAAGPASRSRGSAIAALAGVSALASIVLALAHRPRSSGAEAGGPAATQSVVPAARTAVAIHPSSGPATAPSQDGTSAEGGVVKSDGTSAAGGVVNSDATSAAGGVVNSFASRGPTPNEVDASALRTAPIEHRPPTPTGARPTRAKGDAQALEPTDEGPKYRTSW
jgi:serine/threonine-protein kinase